MSKAALSCPINLQNVTLLSVDCLPVVQAQLAHRPPQNFFGRGVQVKVAEIKDRERVIATNKIQVVVPVKHRKDKRTLDFLRHRADGREVQGFLLFEQLYSDIAVGLNPGIRKILGLSELFIIPEHTIVRQCKGSGRPRMIIEVVCRFALCGKSGVSHDNMNPVGYTEFELMRSERAFVNFDVALKVVGDAGRIGAAHFAFLGEYLQNLVFLPRG